MNVVDGARVAIDAKVAAIATVTVVRVTAEVAVEAAIALVVVADVEDDDAIFLTVSVHHPLFIIKHPLTTN